VIAESFERIHRSNLIGMGVLPLQLPEGESADSLGLTGEEVFAVDGLDEAVDPDASGPRSVRVKGEREDAEPVQFDARVRLDTPNEVGYYRNGGILQRVLRDLR
jgi:aconitate hydratase